MPSNNPSPVLAHVACAPNTGWLLHGAHQRLSTTRQRITISCIPYSQQDCWTARNPWRGMSKEGRARLDVPVVALDGVQRERVGELLDGHGVLQVLLVGHDQHRRARQVLVPQQREQLRLQET